MEGGGAFTWESTLMIFRSLLFLNSNPASFSAITCGDATRAPQSGPSDPS
jgi:hypothetical protein